MKTTKGTEEGDGLTLIPIPNKARRGSMFEMSAESFEKGEHGMLARVALHSDEEMIAASHDHDTNHAIRPTEIADETRGGLTNGPLRAARE